jgi:hypothetical protein
VPATSHFIEQVRIVLKPGVMSDVDVAMALAEGTAFMVTGKAALFVAILQHSFGRPGVDAQGTAIDARPMRPRAARIPALLTLRSALRTLRRITVVVAPLALGLGAPAATPYFVALPHFSEAEGAECSAEGAEPILLRPAVAVARRRSACPRDGPGTGVQDNAGQPNSTDDSEGRKAH